MITKQHRITAIFLALLVLTSTVGIGMNTMLCKCTGKHYIPMFSATGDSECCKSKKAKDKPTKNRKTDCCSKSQNKKCSEKQDINEPLIKADKKCCSSDFQYVKADIDFNYIIDEQLPTSNYVDALVFGNNYYVEPQKTKIAALLTKTSNKAPPNLYGKSLLHRYQIYRC
jgi:hypothetical protein